MLYPTVKYIEKLHKYILESLGGESGVLNESNLQSATDRPATRIHGETPFKNEIAKATALAYAIITWHPFIDGNKRTALYSMVDMLATNGVWMVIPPYIVKYMVGAALLKDSTGYISEEEFARKIGKLCYRAGVAGWFKRVRYSKLPELELKWSSYWANKLIGSYKKVMDPQTDVPRFLVRYTRKFSQGINRDQIYQLFYGRVIDWFAAGDLSILLNTLEEHKKWEKEGYPKPIPFPEIEKDDYREME